MAILFAVLLLLELHAPVVASQVRAQKVHLANSHGFFSLSNGSLRVDLHPDNGYEGSTVWREFGKFFDF